MEYSELPSPEREAIVPVDDLTVDGDNPNEQPDEMFGLLCDNMQRKGWIGNAIVADTDGIIADGEHRWRAAQEIGLEEVPVKFYDLDDTERRLWRQELNKISGYHDRKRDALEYKHLLDNGRSDDVQKLVDATGEDLDELLDLIAIDNRVQPGYEFKPLRNVYFEDCVTGMQERLDDASVDCVITDPPYGMDFHGDATEGSGSRGAKWAERVKSWNGIEGDRTIEEAVELLDTALVEITRALKQNGHAYIFCDWRGIDEIKPLIDRHLTVKNVIVWDKGSMGIGDLENNYGYSHEFIIFATKGDRAHPLQQPMRNLLSHGRIPRTDYVHPTQKPVSLLVDLLKTGTEPGDVVLDPFLGSGATAVAAVQLGREIVGFEVDEENYRPVIERLVGEAQRQVDE